MKENKKKRAIISVSDKTGIVDFAEKLDGLGYEIVSTGGTYKALREAGIDATYVTQVTGFPEILDGRVKTLHPFVHAGILAMRNDSHLKQLEDLGIAPVDLVVVNLYPFRQTIAKQGVQMYEALENIDIGGPSMIRAAAKNYKYVLVVVKPERYSEILNMLTGGEIDEDKRLALAAEAFSHTAEYDAYISQYLVKKTGASDKYPEIKLILGEMAQKLRYGENPHQTAAFYKNPDDLGVCVANSRQVQGKELSFNNIIDLNAALELVREFNEPAAVIIKHTNPCGVAQRDNIIDAYNSAFIADSKSAYGGIVGLNRLCGEDIANAMVKTFFEAVIAPAFSEEALEVFKKKPNIRLLIAGELSPDDVRPEIKSVNGGFLVQDSDSLPLTISDLKTVSKRLPSEKELQEMLFAWSIVKHVKSNAIVVTKDRCSLGVGAGQMNRVGSANIAFEQAGENCLGAVMASDAYFPFRDTVDAAAAAGITAIIQPGGSIRDAESIEAIDEHNMVMVFTNRRHFKH